ncbi:four-carbon acid sugar kinase family protein [Roseibium sp.]|uniref:four-carbon acid sugar kinase family protein n=1 Tax=Roseibium sp. TaxID=1936156 RepID=UPI003266538E
MTGALFISYYGDDFTGSTDVMEALTTGGIETVLFTSIPDKKQLARFKHCRAVGLAGISRSQAPGWMSETLPAIFSWLKSLDARFCHYKTCSTFDSSPEKGSIGRALEIGLETFSQRRTVVVVGAPQLRRYTFFGTLFAAYGEQVYRIDRHPVMSRHPATPMHEADLIEHLSLQTDLPFECLTPLDGSIAAPRTHQARETGQARTASRLIDVYDSLSQAAAGGHIEDNRQDLGPFIAGSSGVEYALLRRWRELDLLPPPAVSRPLAARSRIAVVSGSCSPTTARQIETAEKRGFEGVPVNFNALATGDGLQQETDRVLQIASTALEAGQSPVLYTAKGKAAAPVSGPLNLDGVGKTLGRLLATLKDRHHLERVAVAGGDTSSHALAELDVFALTLRQAIPTTPGSPVCTAHTRDGPEFEIALKGGQIGTDTYFADLRDGTFGT